MLPEITADSVDRWFSLDLPSMEIHTKHHDEILDALLDEENAKESLSGHTGFLVSIRNDERTDEEIMASLKNRLLAMGIWK